MEFSTDAKSLAESLDQVQEAVEKKSTIPILSHVLVEACANGLKLAATDLEVGIRTFCPAQVKATGSSAVPARRLLEIVKALPDADVRVRDLENHWVQVNAGRSVFKLAALAKDTFPALPDIPKALAEVPAGVLAGLIDRTAFAISSEESRYTLNGALLVLKPNKVEMVATDGHRLALAARDVEIAGLKGDERLLIPKRALAGLRRLANAQQSDSPIHIAKDDSHLFFTAGESILISRMLSGQFPAYEAVLPKNNTITATLDAAARGAPRVRADTRGLPCARLKPAHVDDLGRRYGRGLGNPRCRLHRRPVANWLQRFVPPRRARHRQGRRSRDWIEGCRERRGIPTR